MASASSLHFNKNADWAPTKYRFSANMPKLVSQSVYSKIFATIVKKRGCATTDCMILIYMPIND